MPFLLVACAPPETATREFDELMHFFFAHYEDGSDEDLLDAADEIARFVTAERGKGTFSDLTEEEQDTVPMDWDPDPADARGLYVTAESECTFEQVERVLASDEQDVLYAGNYTAYQRDYLPDASAYDSYMAGDTDTLSWQTFYSVDIIGTGAYSTMVYSGQRRVTGADRDLVVSRTWMPSPAECEDDTTFEQDYQLDAWWTRDGGTANAFAQWRELAIGPNPEQSLDDDTIATLVLGGLQGFQDDTEAICAEGRI